MNEAPASPGARLKAERERRGLSAQKAADEMHLDAWVIDALEAGEYARIGPPVYAKGHLKKYAAMLNLAPAELVADFDAKMAPNAAQAARNPLGSSLDTPPIYTASAGQLFGVLAVFALLGGLLWWRPWQQRNPHAAGSASVPASPASAPSAAEELTAETDPEVLARATTAAQDIPPARVAPVIAAKTASAPRSAPIVTPKNETPPKIAPISAPKLEATPKAVPAMVHATPAAQSPAVPVKTMASTNAPAVASADPANLPGAGRAKLRLSFTADSWVDVRDAQGNRAYVGNGSANTVKTIAGQAPMRVYLRAGSGVQLEINGHAVAIGPQFFAGDAARFEAGADGVLRRDTRREQPAHPTG